MYYNMYVIFVEYVFGKESRNTYTASAVVLLPYFKFEKYVVQRRDRRI